MNRKSNLTALLVLIVALGTADRCDAQAQVGPPVNADTPPPAAVAPRLRTHRSPHRTPAQVVESNVRRLAQGLKLDEEQQAKLRAILTDQYVALTKLRIESPPNMDRTGAMQAIVERTRQRVREMLNDEQKKQYAKDVPSEVTAATRGDLEHWLDVRDAQRREGVEEVK